MSNSSFVNGLIASGGIGLAIMSIGFLNFVAPLENQFGISGTELRVAIVLGGVVAVASIGYEYYLRKSSKTQDNIKSNETPSIEQIAAEAQEAAKIATKKAEEVAKIIKDTLGKKPDSESIENKVE